MTRALSILRDSRPENLRALLEFADEACEALGVDAEAAFDVRLAVEEVCTNLIRHAYPPEAPGPIEVRIGREGDAVHVEVRDRAAPFDPSTAPPPDLDSPWADRRVGGLGWHLVRQKMDALRYESGADGNRLTMTRRLGREAESGAAR